MNASRTRSAMRQVRLTVCSLFVAVGLVACGGGTDQEPESRARALSASPAQSQTAAVALTAETAPEVLGLLKVAERRISRTVFEYVFRLEVKGRDIDLYDVSVKLVSTGAGTSIVQPAAYVGNLGRLKTSNSETTVVVRHDRSVSFGSTGWRWEFTAFKPISPIAAVTETLDLGGDTKVADGEIIIDGADQASHQAIVESLESLGWAIVGHSALQKSYQVRIPGALTLLSLEAAITTAQNLPEVAGASLNPIVATLNQPVPDPIAADVPGNRYNWPFRAINMYSAWQDVYANKTDGDIPQIDVGIVDAWFESGEVDLTIEGSGTWSPQSWALLTANQRETVSHGNFVAGIIGARSDSYLSLGMAHRRTVLKGYSNVLAGAYVPIINGFSVLNSIEKAVLEKVRIVNVSIGVASLNTYNRCDIKKLGAIVDASAGQTLFVAASGNRADQGQFADGRGSTVLGYGAALNPEFSAGCPFFNVVEAASKIRKQTLVVGAFAPNSDYDTGVNDLVIPWYSELPRDRGAIVTTDSGSINLDDFYPYVLAPGGITRFLPNANGQYVEDFPATIYSNSLPLGYTSGRQGTSFSAPHVAGVAALVLQANPDLSAAQVRDLILLSANKRCSADGYLVLNAARAVALARSPGSATVPVCQEPAVAAPSNELPPTCYTLGAESITFSANFHEACLQPRGVTGGFGTLHEFPLGDLLADMLTNYNGATFSLKCESPSSCVWGWGSVPVEGRVRQMRFASSYLNPSFASITLTYRDSAFRSYYDFPATPTLNQLSLYDDFAGTEIDASKWTRVLNPSNASSTAAISGGELRLAYGAWLHTHGKATFKGRKIVIEGVMGDTESSILLIDSFDPVTGQSAGTIMGSETLYRGWGFSVQAGGRYPIVGPTTSGSITVAEGQNVLVSWEHSPSLVYRRLTVDGDIVTFERGDSPNSITRRLSTRLAASISGRPLTLVLGTGVGPYTPGRIQSIQVTVTP